MRQWRGFGKVVDLATPGCEKALMKKLKRLVRDFGLAVLRACGTTTIDAETGANLGRAFLFPWKGSIKVIGLQTPVRPVFRPQTRLTYWKQDLVFTAHPPPDFPRCGKGS